MNLGSILADKDLPIDQSIKLQDLICELENNEDVAGVLLFGSVAKSDSDEFSDIDIIVYANNGNFTTSEQVYDTIAKNYFKPVAAQVKNANEFSPNNKVTLEMHMLKQYNSVGIWLLDKCNLQQKLKQSCDSKCFGAQAQHLWYNLYRVRKDLLLSKYVENGLTKAEKHIHPLSPAHFYQQAVRRVLNVEFPKEQDKRVAIVKRFYDLVGLPDKSSEIEELRKKDKTDSTDIAYFKQFKNIIEEAAWALNGYLNKK